jgi:hypothetical protein
MGNVKAGQGRDAFQVVEVLHTLAHYRQQSRAIHEDAFDDLADSFPHDQFLSINKGEHGVGRSFSGFDQVAIYDHRVSIQASQFDHGREFLCGVYRRVREKVKKLKSGS